ncbi:MAG: hypothetical protein EXR17_03985 [Flavobacteriaceae bacterium]|nr:hypothetical protein [Flavobacteriaceae bacterium]
MKKFQLAISKQQWMIGILVSLIVVVAMMWVSFSGKSANRVIQGIEISLVPDKNPLFITKKILYDSIVAIVGIPTGINASALNITLLESKLKQIPTLQKAEVYLRLDGILKIQAMERSPIALIKNLQGEEFYIDTQGVMVPNKNFRFCDVLIVNGKIPNKMNGGSIMGGEIAKNILALAKFIAADSLWNAQFQQCYVDNYNAMILIPRIGKHSIVVGNSSELGKKFENLRLFYAQGLKGMGWNRYKTIDISNITQVLGIRLGQQSIHIIEKKSKKSNT